MKPAKAHYNPNIALLAIREHLEDARIPTIFDKGETYGDARRKLYLDVSGYIQVYMDGGKFNLTPCYAYFDVPGWDESNKFSNPQAEIDAAIADIDFVNQGSGFGRNAFSPHIHIHTIDLQPPNSLQSLLTEFKRILHQHEQWKATERSKITLAPVEKTKCQQN